MQLGAACRDFATAARRLGDHARLVALLESELGTLEGQCGRHRPGPSRRELLAELALGELAPLRPHPPLASEESTEQARAALVAGAQ
jgi:hypothetical protein